MSFDDKQKRTGRNATNSKPPYSQHPETTPNHAHEPLRLAQQYIINSK